MKALVSLSDFVYMCEGDIKFYFYYTKNLQKQVIWAAVSSYVVAAASSVEELHLRCIIWNGKIEKDLKFEILQTYHDHVF